MLNAINFVKTLLIKYKINSQNNGIKFGIAKTKAEINRAYKLRYDVYCKEKKYLREEDYPSGLENDIYDSTAIHFVATNNRGGVIGTLRLIPRNNDSLEQVKLPLEKYTDINNYISEVDNFCELSRFVICKEYRKKYSINFGLVKSAVLYALANGITHFIISVSIKSKDYFEKFGFEQIGKEYVYQKIRYNLPSITMLADIRESLEKMKKINISFYRYFTNE